MHTDSTNVKPGTKAAQSAATRAKLLKVARRLFAKNGYSGVGTEEIVKRAGVTRGALYHQFEDKKDLFRAVFVQLEEELFEKVAARAGTQTDPVEELRSGARYWLELCLDPEVQRIVLLDAPAVLGWHEWREIGGQYGTRLVEAALSGAMEAGVIERQPVSALAHVLMGAMDEAALYVAEADDSVAAGAEIAQVIERIIDTLRPR
ncbi:MAG TPA: TetR/AcrR family transcriptional regulator [Thermoleophilaceae bacterium]|jgi:AcrR family transcriptional regulator|nr:TetR/AcrR family transcriptional regulator [Thermoleophilaceae bacterium]